MHFIFKYKFGFHMHMQTFLFLVSFLKDQPKVLHLPVGLQAVKSMYQTDYFQRNETWKEMIYLELHHSVNKLCKNKFLIQSRAGNYDKL